MSSIDWSRSGILFVDSDPMPEGCGIPAFGFGGSSETNQLQYLVQKFTMLPVERQERSTIRCGNDTFDPEGIRSLARLDDYPLTEKI